MTAFLLGTLIGFTLALTGAGGGILAVPLLVFALHQQVAQAAPVGLLAVGFAAMLGAALGLREGKVRYRAALLIGGTGMLAAPLGVWLSERLPNPPLTILFALVMAYSARSMYRRSLQVPGTTRPLAQPPCVRDPGTGRFIWTRPCAQVLSITGLSSGMLSGLLGVGGGFVIVPALTRYSDLAADGIVNTSLAVIALVSVSGVASAAARGAVNWDIALPFAGGAMLALVVGRQFAQRLAGPRLQRFFAWLSAAVALMLLLRSAAALVAQP
jgi:uncharacterized membrane protein YfcA